MLSTACGFTILVYFAPECVASRAVLSALSFLPKKLLSYPMKNHEKERASFLRGFNFSKILLMLAFVDYMRL